METSTRNSLHKKSKSYCFSFTDKLGVTYTKRSTSAEAILISPKEELFPQIVDIELRRHQLAGQLQANLLNMEKVLDKFENEQSKKSLKNLLKTVRQNFSELERLKLQEKLRRSKSLSIDKGKHSFIVDELVEDGLRLRKPSNYDEKIKKIQSMIDMKGRWKIASKEDTDETGSFFMNYDEKDSIQDTASDCITDHHANVIPTMKQLELMIEAQSLNLNFNLPLPPPKPIPEEAFKISGFITLFTKSFFISSWKTYWFNLDRHVLTYQRNSSSQKPLGSLYLKSAIIEDQTPQYREKSGCNYVLCLKRCYVQPTNTFLGSLTNKSSSPKFVDILLAFDNFEYFTRWLLILKKFTCCNAQDFDSFIKMADKETRRSVFRNTTASLFSCKEKESIKVK